ncbi:MAG: S9 family peptidase [Propionibacteriaceae bacterium]|nr:S9 family peptidase [Propionibacteriaceae bacterium]
MVTAPYGSWSSPVTVEMMTSASVGLGAPTVDGGDLYWTESRADQGGRTSLWRQSSDGTRREVTPDPFYVRTRVHEYGGGEYSARSGTVVFSHFGDGRVYVVRGDGQPTPLTPERAHRFADLRLHPQHDLVLAVREDHTGPGEAVNTIVALELDGSNDDGGVVLCSGADFYANPELSADGRLAWTEWNHPSMPWDSTAIRVGDFDDNVITNPQRVVGREGESAIQPRWMPNGALIFISDRSNWWNLYAWSDGAVQPLHEAEAEFCGPQWRFGQSPYAVIDDDNLLVTWSQAGGACLGRLALSTGQLTALLPPATAASSVSVSGRNAAAVLSTRDQPVKLGSLDLSTGEWTDVRISSDVAMARPMISVAESVSWSSELGPVFGWFYPPTNSDFDAPVGTLPPLITLSHGGPTANSGPGFDLSVQYWTSRGFAILDVNYGGSSGYGRAYRQRLKGAWGIVDVADCAQGAVAMGENALVDPRRLAIAGGSAGGYTTLRALTTTNVFTAGVSLYGVGDLEGLAKDTHKFESRYLDGLIGPYPDAIDVYRERSPIYHVDQLSAPILILQGEDDMVVPLNQAAAMAAAARAKKLPVALIIFPGEGHGFRRAENIKASIEAQLYFLSRVFNFAPADDLPPIQIENLPAGSG